MRKLVKTAEVKKVTAREEAEAGTHILGPSAEFMRERCEADEQIAAKQDLRPKFLSPNRPKETPISDWFFGIQEKVFVDGDDPESVYDALEGKLKASDKLGHHNAALDEAEANWRLAHRLYMTAKVERLRWEQDNDTTFASLWEAANRELQTEKDLGNRSKQITDADIKARCAKLFPDEMRAQEVARARAKATEDTLAHLVEAWGQKCKSLNTIVGRGGR